MEAAFDVVAGGGLIKVVTRAIGQSGQIHLFVIHLFIPIHSFFVRGHQLLAASNNSFSCFELAIS